MGRIETISFLDDLANGGSGNALRL